MPRLLSVAVTATLCLTFTARAEEKLPQGMKPILDKVVRDVRTNREAFDKANKKPLEEARKALEALSTKLIKDGKTVDAGVVLKQVETLEADVMKMANAPAPVAGGGRLAPQKQLPKRLVGKWNRPKIDLYWVIQEDGTAGARRIADNTPAHPDSVVRIINQDVAELTWPGGITWRLRMAGDDVIAAEEFDASGVPLSDGVVLTRAK